VKKSYKLQVTDDQKLCASHSGSRHSSLVTRHCPAFTLIELLVVITILGILAGLSVPALKNIGKSDANTSAARQLLDDVGRARQFAISQHTTVYMVFVPTNFWNNLPIAQRSNRGVTNLCDKQMTGYTFVSTGAVGDQPGRHAWHYLAPWQNLPDGTFIAQQKFQQRSQTPYTITDAASGAAYTIYGFENVTNVPFPFETNSTAANPQRFFLPCIAFNYLGQLTTSQLTPAPSTQDEYIPLAAGTVSPAINPATRALQLGTASATETPPGNSTNSAYNIIQIDALTGRAVLKFQKLP
jgi:prepilin-type N-terminal cleavage/methylation domain-containing protein